MTAASNRFRFLLRAVIDDAEAQQLALAAEAQADAREDKHEVSGAS